MATVVATRTQSKNGRNFERWYGVSASNTIITMSTTVAPGVLRKLISVTATYSGAATQAGVTVTLDSGLGASYDSILSTGTANALTTFYNPTAEIILFPDDIIKVDAPAGGAVTCNVIIVTEILPN